MKNNVYLLLSVFCLAAAPIQAGKSMDQSSRHEEENSSPWRAGANVGYLRAKLTLDNPSAVQFNTATTPAGDPNNSSNAGVVGLSLDRNLFCDWLSAGVSYDIYSQFNYDEYVTANTQATGGGALGVNEILSDSTIPYARSFALNHQSAMFNVNFHVPADWAMSVRSMNVSPVLGAGVGAGLSRVVNFQSVGWSAASAGVLQLTSLAPNNSHVSVAWQATAGLNFQPADSSLSFSFVYRYYEAQKYETSNKFMLNDATNKGAQATLTAWTGKIKTQQVRMCLDFEF